MTIKAYVEPSKYTQQNVVQLNIYSVILNLYKTHCIFLSKNSKPQMQLFNQTILQTQPESYPMSADMQGTL